MVDPGPSKSRLFDEPRTIVRPASPQSESRGALLIVEPERLLRWSMATYLSRWFSIYPTDCEADAAQILHDNPIDAVVISDDLAGRAAEEIEACARSTNPSVRIVWTVTSPRLGRHPSGLREPTIPSVEKPFDLAHLASLLGVSGVSDHERKKHNGCSPQTT